MTRTAYLVAALALTTAVACDSDKVITGARCFDRVTLFLEPPLPVASGTTLSIKGEGLDWVCDLDPAVECPDGVMNGSGPDLDYLEALFVETAQSSLTVSIETPEGSVSESLTIDLEQTDCDDPSEPEHFTGVVTMSYSLGAGGGGGSTP